MWMLSPPSTPTQNRSLGQERPNIASSPWDDTRTGVHDRRTRPSDRTTRVTESTNAPMTQKLVLGHDTLSNLGFGR